MQYPDSSDCGLQKVPCFTFGDLPSGSTEDASKFDEANSWGKCENGMQSEGIGGTCAAYPLRQTYEEGKAINVPVGRGWAGPDNTYLYEDEVEVRVKIWKSDPPDRYTSRTISAGQSPAWHHHINRWPERIKVVSQISDGGTWFYDAVGAAQSTDFRKYKNHKTYENQNTN